MNLEQLFLKKEELPILGNLRKIFFEVPIHPRLLDPTLKIDKSIAQRLFLQTAEEWYEDLKDYTPFSKEEVKWINDIFSKRKSEKGRRDRVLFMNNGFVKSFSINKEKDGTLFFTKQELNYRYYALVFLNFSEEKYKEFAFEKEGTNIFVYSHKDIDTFPKALFLRNWAIEYMNEAFKKIF